MSPDKVDCDRCGASCLLVKGGTAREKREPGNCLPEFKSGGIKTCPDSRRQNDIANFLDGVKREI